MSPRQLVLIRHAQAESQESGGADFERPLTAEGERVSTALGEFLAARADFRPQRICCSPAVRAWTTAQLIAGPLHLASGQVVEEPRIYDATPGDLVSLVQGLGPDHDFVVVVGHNPALSRLADWLLGGSKIDEMPPAAVAWLEISEGWDQALPGCARLRHYWSPEQLALLGEETH